MCKYILIVLSILVSACDFSSLGSSEKESLDGLYTIDSRALILNSDNTFTIAHYPGCPIICGTGVVDYRWYEYAYDYRKSRVKEMPDSLKGTYYIKNSFLYFDKVYKVIKVRVHDYEHDTLYQKKYDEAVYKYEQAKSKEYKIWVERRKKRPADGVPLIVNMPFYPPPPTEKYVSYLYDTIYYKSIKEVYSDLNSQYHLHLLVLSRNNYVCSGYLDTRIHSHPELRKEAFIDSLSSNLINLKNRKFNIDFSYYINQSGKVDSLSVRLSDSINSDLYEKSRELLSQVKDWPKGRLYGKPVNYRYYGSFEIKN